MKEPDIATRLMRADGLEDETATESRQRQQLFEKLLAHELVFERRVRRLALVTWAATLAALPMAGLMIFWAQNGAGTSQEGVRSILVVLMIFGGLTLLVALLATTAWLFRSRAPSMAAIERRLAAIEHHLTRQ